MKKRTLILNEMKLSHALKILLAESEKASMAEVARDLGMKETTFRSAIARESIRLADFLALTDVLGYDVIIRDKTFHS